MNACGLVGQGVPLGDLDDPVFDGPEQLAVVRLSQGARPHLEDGSSLVRLEREASVDEAERAAGWWR
jgi:hypothetical protein